MIPQVLLLLAGLVLVVKGGDLFVAAAVRLAECLRMPRVVIGSTLVSLTTTTPELVVAITAGSRGESGLAVGNVLGANIANLTLIVGTAALIQDVGMSRMTQLFNLPAMLVVMVLLLWMLLTDRRITRREGSVLLGSYGLYLAVLVILTLWQNRS